MELEFVGIREFSKKLSKYIKDTRPIVIMKHGKPFRLISNIEAPDLKGIKEKQQIASVLKHRAIGLWKRRWPAHKSSVRILKDLRENEEQRSIGS